jgi:hypothetical protein
MAYIPYLNLQQAVLDTEERQQFLVVCKKVAEAPPNSEELWQAVEELRRFLAQAESRQSRSTDYVDADGPHLLRLVDAKKSSVDKQK